jgi:hypothetical protein
MKRVHFDDLEYEEFLLWKEAKRGEPTTDCEPSAPIAEPVKLYTGSVVGSLGTKSCRSMEHAKQHKKLKRPINPFNSKTIAALTMVCNTIGVECKKDLDNALKDEDLQYYLECVKAWQCSKDYERKILNEIIERYVQNIAENEQQKFDNHCVQKEYINIPIDEFFRRIELGELLITYKPQIWLQFHGSDLPTEWDIHETEDYDNNFESDDSDSDSDSETEDEKPPNTEREQQKKDAILQDINMRYNVCLMLAFFGFHVQLGQYHLTIAATSDQTLACYELIHLKMCVVDPTIPLHPNCKVFPPVKK